MIEIKGFTKRYDDNVAVRNLSLAIEQGDIYGFIGPNGAGKTTTLRFLATLLKPTTGSAKICGHNVRKQPDKVKRCMGFMPDHFGVYDGMRVWEFLDFFALAYGIPARKRRGIVDDVLVLLDLHAKRDDLVNGLSRGMTQRLGLAKTLIHDPPVLILDEPASGMDPRARIEIRELLKELRSMGKTILISSHILSELAGCCNKIGIIERGKLVAHGPVADILATVQKNRILKITVTADPAAARALLAKNPHVSNILVAGNLLTCGFGGTADDIVSLHLSLVQNGVRLLWFGEEQADLEDVFLEVTRGEVA